MTGSTPSVRALIPEVCTSPHHLPPKSKAKDLWLLCFSWGGGTFPLRQLAGPRNAARNSAAQTQTFPGVRPRALRSGQSSLPSLEANVPQPTRRPPHFPAVPTLAPVGAASGGWELSVQLPSPGHPKQITLSTLSRPRFGPSHFYLRVRWGKEEKKNPEEIQVNWKEKISKGCPQQRKKEISLINSAPILGSNTDTGSERDQTWSGGCSLPAIETRPGSTDLQTTTELSGECGEIASHPDLTRNPHTPPHYSSFSQKGLQLHHREAPFLVLGS
nr:uncharacterized protein LOC105729645 [Aotus nancymaae]